MCAHEILRYGSKTLSERAQEIPEFDENVRKLIERMYGVMAEAGGFGLAANQIGVPLRLFVYDVGEGPHALANPKIAEKSGSEIGTEGCLSIPGLQGEVERAEVVAVEGIDEDGNKVRIEGEGLLARVLQHEIDHLDGTLFIDRADADTLHWVIHEQGGEEAK
jgi:peptide deformylase